MTSNFDKKIWKWKLGLHKAMQPSTPTSFLKIPLPSSGKLFVSPMPYGPYDTRGKLFKTYLRKGIQTVLVLVTDEELKKKGKRDILKLYEQNDIQVLRMPFKDLVAPVYEDIAQVMPQVLDALDGGRLAIHCNAGAGRTGVIAACIAAQILECSGDAAVEHIINYMRIQITDEQNRFIQNWAEKAHTETSNSFA